MAAQAASKHASNVAHKHAKARMLQNAPTHIRLGSKPNLLTTPSAAAHTLWAIKQPKLTLKQLQVASRTQAKSDSTRSHRHIGIHKSGHIQLAKTWRQRLVPRVSSGCSTSPQHNLFVSAP